VDVSTSLYYLEVIGCMASTAIPYLGPPLGIICAFAAKDWYKSAMKKCYLEYLYCLENEKIK
jgi:hypothetical protein